MKGLGQSFGSDMFGERTGKSIVILWNTPNLDIIHELLAVPVRYITQKYGFTSNPLAFLGQF